MDRVPGIALERHGMLAQMKAGEAIKRWATRIKRDGLTLWFAGKHPATPWTVKALAAFVVAYALSSIDLIPDFIPVLGYMDDVLLLPGLIWLTIRLLPPQVLADCRDQADSWMRVQGSQPSSRVGAIVIVLIWIAVSAAIWIGLVQPRL